MYKLDTFRQAVLSCHIDGLCASEKRAYYCGIALSAPFITALVPLPAIVVFMLLAAPLVVNFARCGGNITARARDIPSILFMGFALAVLHLLGLWIGETPFWSAVIVDILWIAACSGVYLFGMGLGRAYSNQLLQGFFSILIPTSMVIAVLGLVKVILFQNGFVLGPLLEVFQDGYPRGTSFRRDYNLFGLSLLVASIGLMLRSLETPTFYRSLIKVCFPLALIAGAALFSGSRRVLVLLAFLPIFWLVVGARKVSARLFFQRVFIPMMLVIIGVGLTNWAMLNIKVSNEFAALNIQGISSVPYDFKKIASNNNPITSLNTIYNGSALTPRSERWRLGLSLLQQTNWLGASGFSYHKAFACEYLECKFLDYPHLVFISEWLIGGIPGLLLAMLIYATVLRATAKNGWSGLYSGSSAVFLLVLPFSIASGDTILSLPQLFIAGLLVCEEQKKRLLKQ